MEKSIKDIWHNGFANHDIVAIPKVMDLYNKKSILLIDKIKRTYQIDNKALIPMAVVCGLVCGFLGHILLGLYVMLLLVVLFFTNKNLLQSLENIRITTNSYDYLVSYRNAIKKIVRTTNKIIVLIFPLAIIPIYWFVFKNTETYNNIIHEIEPLYLFLSVLGLAIIISLIGVFIYKISTKMLYGSYLHQLDALISDLDVLTTDIDYK
jgi:hypothetical protein